MLSPEGSRGRVALADLVFGDKARQAGASATLGVTNGWDLVAELGARWHVAALLQRRLERLDGVPASILIRLRQLSGVATAHSSLTLHRAFQASSLLESSGIRTLAVKGVATIVQLYGTPAARLVGDFDCLVAEGDARGAEGVLVSGGFVSENVPFDTHMRQIDVSPRLHNYARMYTRDGFEVDLHWRLGRKPPEPLQAATLLARSSLLVALGGALRVPHPVDAQLLTVHHAMRGGFLPSTTLKDLGDLDAWWALRADAWDLDELVGRAIASGLGGSLLALWSVLAERDASNPVAAGVLRLETALSGSERRAGHRLARFFEAQLAQGDYAARTIELFALPQLGRSAIAELGRRASRDTGDKKSLAQRVAGFAQRSLRVARDLANVRQLSAYAAVARAQRRWR